MILIYLKKERRKAGTDELNETFPNQMNRVFLLVVFAAVTTALVLPRPRQPSVAAGTFRVMEEAFNATDFSGFQVDDDDTETGRFSAREASSEYGDEDYEYDEPVFYEDYGSYEDIYDN